MKKILVIILLMQCFMKGVGQQRPVFTITDYHAKGDSVTNNTIAIQHAIDDAAKAGGGKVVVPKGKFVTATIYLKTGVELNLQTGAVLLASTDRLEYGTGSASALITATGQNNISITGKGTINGRGRELVKNLLAQLAAGKIQDKQWRIKAPEERNRPKLITFIECKNVTIKDITLTKAASWVQEYRRCDSVLIDHINVLSNEYWNNDGIDINNSKNVTITNCNINVADDAICLKSETEVLDSCVNIYISNCILRSSASAFKIGTGSHGGFRNIKVRNLTVYNTYRSAIALESVDGGFLEDVDIQNIKAKNTGNAILIRLGHRNKDNRYSSLKNIRIADVYVEVSAGKPDKRYPMEGPGLKYPPGFTPVKGIVQSVSPWNNSTKDSTAIPYLHNVFPSSVTGLAGHAVENVKLENIELIYLSIADKSVNYFPLDSFHIITEAEAAYPEFSMFGELPVWGFYVRHVNGLAMENVTVTMKGKDFRTAFLYNDVKNLWEEKVTTKQGKAKPAGFYNDVTNAEAQRIKKLVN